VKQNINTDDQVLVMCAAGGRSIIAADLLANAGYKTLNVSDGFSGNGQDPGWKNLGLPSVINN
jgi:rhodanese-related sulfurtransferase